MAKDINAKNKQIGIPANLLLVIVLTFCQNLPTTSPFAKYIITIKTRFLYKIYNCNFE